MIVTFDLASGLAEVEDPADQHRLQVKVYGEALFFLDAMPGVVVVGYEPVEDEQDMLVTLAEIAPRRWCVAARHPPG